MSFTCPEQNDLVLQGEVGEVGDALGPFNEGEKLLISSVAYVGDRVIRLKKRNKKHQSTVRAGSGTPVHPFPISSPAKHWQVDGAPRPHTEFSMFISP